MLAAAFRAGRRSSTGISRGKIVALSVTNESVGDITEFCSLRGQSMDRVGVKGVAGASVHWGVCTIKLSVVVYYNYNIIN